MYSNFLCHKFLSNKNKLIFCSVLIGYPWLRLTKSREKNPLISYNPEHIQEPESIRQTYDSKNNYFCTCNLDEMLSCSANEKKQIQCLLILFRLYSHICFSLVL